MPATRAIELLMQHGVAYALHEFAHDPTSRSFGREAADALDVSPSRVFKTLVVSADADLVVAVVPVETELDLKAVAKAVGTKRASMAAPITAKRSSGYVLGGISPLGQKRSLVTVIDDSAQHFRTIFVSAGRRGLEVELAPEDLALLCDARFVALARESR